MVGLRGIHRFDAVCYWAIRCLTAPGNARMQSVCGTVSVTGPCGRSGAAAYVDQRSSQAKLSEDQMLLLFLCAHRGPASTNGRVKRLA